MQPIDAMRNEQVWFSVDKASIEVRGWIKDKFLHSNIQFLLSILTSSPNHSLVHHLLFLLKTTIRVCAAFLISSLVLDLIIA